RELRGRSEILMNNMDPFAIQGDTSSKREFNALSPKAVLSYQINPEKLLFLSYSRGFRAGGISQLTSDPSEPALMGYDPEFSNNYELGIKNDFMNNRLRWNISAFYTTVDDIQIPQLV